MKLLSAGGDSFGSRLSLTTNGFWQIRRWNYLKIKLVKFSGHNFIFSWRVDHLSGLMLWNGVVYSCVERSSSRFFCQLHNHWRISNVHVGGRKWVLVWEIGFSFSSGKEQLFLVEYFHIAFCLMSECVMVFILGRGCLVYWSDSLFAVLWRTWVMLPVIHIRGLFDNDTMMSI